MTPDVVKVREYDTYTVGKWWRRSTLAGARIAKLLRRRNMWVTSVSRYAKSKCVKFLLHTTMSITSTITGAGTKGRPIVFFDISIGDTPVGRIKFELYNDVVPK